jgi:hypothetical protein
MRIIYEIAISVQRKALSFKSSTLLKTVLIENCSQVWGLYQTAAPFYRLILRRASVNKLHDTESSNLWSWSEDKEIFSPYGTRHFIIAFTKALCWTPSYAILVLPIPPHCYLTAWYGNIQTHVRQWAYFALTWRKSPPLTVLVCCNCKCCWLLLCEVCIFDLRTIPPTSETLQRGKSLLIRPCEA